MVEDVSDPSAKTLRVAVTNRGTVRRGIFRRETHYLGCVHTTASFGEPKADERDTSPLKAIRTRAGLGRERISAVDVTSPHLVLL